MTTSREMILIGGVVGALDRRGSWCSETHIQKTLYIAKHVKKIPLDAEYVLYKHGPYSFDLNKSVSHMLTRSILYSTPHLGYGPSLSLNQPMWNALDAAAQGYFGRYKETIEFVCDALARKNVADLERIATAVFVFLNFSELTKERKVEKLSELKPHIRPDLAMLAFEEIKAFV